MLELVRRRTQNFTIIDWGNIKQNKFIIFIYYGNIDLRHQYGISVAKGQTSTVARSEEIKHGRFRRLNLSGLFSSPLHGEEGVSRLL